MGLIGSLVGGVAGIAGSIYGGKSASKAMKKVQKNLQNQMKENQDWYDRRYNEDTTQRADAQALLTATQESIRKRNQAAAGSQAVMGGTEESVAATKAANNEALAQTVSNIVVNGEQRKDNIESQYQQKKSQLNDALNNLEIGKAQAVSQAVQGVASSAGSIAGIF